MHLRGLRTMRLPRWMRKWVNPGCLVVVLLAAGTWAVAIGAAYLLVRWVL